MAFLIKNRREANVTSGSQTQGTIAQWIHVANATNLFPQSTTGRIFDVIGGRVLVYWFIAEITVATTTDPQASFLHKRLNAAMDTAVGTAVTLASTTALTSKEVGVTMNILGSGAAFVVNNAGAMLSTLGRTPFVVPNGELYISTAASQAGQAKYDLWYQPLDEGAFVRPAVYGGAAGIMSAVV